MTIRPMPVLPPIKYEVHFRILKSFGGLAVGDHVFSTEQYDPNWARAVMTFMDQVFNDEKIKIPENSAVVIAVYHEFAGGGGLVTDYQNPVYFEPRQGGLALNHDDL